MDYSDTSTSLLWRAIIACHNDAPQSVDITSLFALQVVNYICATGCAQLWWIIMVHHQCGTRYHC